MALVNRPAGDLVRDWGIYFLLLALFVGAAGGVPRFGSADNLANIAMQAAALGVVAVGQTFVIVGGMFDLSVGQLLGLAVVVVCAFIDGGSGLTMPGIALAIGMGGVIGAINGWMLNLLRIHSLILTFGTMSILQGIIFTYTDRSIGAPSAEIIWLAHGRIGGIPVAVVILVLIGVAGHLALTRTRFGQHLRAVGGNLENARRAGISVNRVRQVAFILSGLSAGMGAVLVAGRLGTGYPNAGQGFELDAIVAVALGGTSLAGGRGSIAGTIAAVFLLAMISNVLNLMEVSSFVQMLTKGLIIVVAVLFGQPRRRT